MGSFGISDNNTDNSPQIFEAAEIANSKEHRIASVKAGNKPPKPQSNDYSRSQKMPGNHQSPSGNRYESNNALNENSNNQEMEFEEDSQNEDNGNVDMDADDQGDKMQVQTPPKKNWTINKKTDLTNVSPDEYKDQVNSMKSPTWNNDLQAVNSDNQISQVVEDASAS